MISYRWTFCVALQSAPFLLKTMLNPKNAGRRTASIRLRPFLYLTLFSWEKRNAVLGSFRIPETCEVGDVRSGSMRSRHQIQLYLISIVSGRHGLTHNVSRDIMLNHDIWSIIETSVYFPRLFGRSFVNLNRYDTRSEAGAHAARRVSSWTVRQSVQHFVVERGTCGVNTTEWLYMC